PPSVPAGAQAYGVVGDPTKEGGYVVRLRFPAGYKVPPHVHPNDENVTVISGTFHIGFGDKFDESKGQAIKAGGYSQAPKGVQHFALTREETGIQLHGGGPGRSPVGDPPERPKKKKTEPWSRGRSCGACCNGARCLRCAGNSASQWGRRMHCLPHSPRSYTTSISTCFGRRSSRSNAMPPLGWTG